MNDFFYFFDEFIVVFFIYNFFKFFIFSSLLELLWPTQFFNKKNNINNLTPRYRHYNEFLLKLRLPNRFYKHFFQFFLKYLFSNLYINLNMLRNIRQRNINRWDNIHGPRR